MKTENENPLHSVFPPPGIRGGTIFGKISSRRGNKIFEKAGGDNFRRGNPDFQITWWRN